MSVGLKEDVSDVQELPDFMIGDVPGESSTAGERWILHVPLHVLHEVQHPLATLLLLPAGVWGTSTLHHFLDHRLHPVLQRTSQSVHKSGGRLITQKLSVKQSRMIERKYWDGDAKEINVIL